MADGWGHRRPDHSSRAEGRSPDTMQPMPLTGGVEIELLLSPFAGLGRMAHVRRQLSGIIGVRGVRIGGLFDRTAIFIVTLQPGLSLETLVLPNTVVASVSASRIELSLRSTGLRHRPFR